jgi:hypothetical protein
MAASVAAQKMTSAVSRDSAFPEGQGQEAEDASRELTEELYPGSTCAVKIRTSAIRHCYDVATAGLPILPAAR